MNRTAIRNIFSQRIELPVTRFLSKVGISPNTITYIGLIGPILTATFIYMNLFAIAGTTLLVSSSLDLFDGSLARFTNKVTKFGAFLDSTIDRLSESIVLLGLIFFYTTQSSIYGVVITYIAMAGSIMVSYIRARAGGLKVSCEIGIYTRTERVISLGLGLIISQWWTPAITLVLSTIAIFTLITTIQRVLHIKRELDRN